MIMYEENFEIRTVNFSQPKEKYLMSVLENSVSSSATVPWRPYPTFDFETASTEERILHYLPLVRNVVDRLMLRFASHVDRDDLMSVGSIGLIKALDNYRPERDSTFTSYAALRINGEIIDEIRRMDWCPRGVRGKLRKLEAARSTLEQTHLRKVTHDEIRDHLCLTKQDYAQLIEDEKRSSLLSLDKELEGGDVSLLDTLHDDQDVTGCQNLVKSESANVLLNCITGLSDLPRQIIILYYFTGKNFKQIAETLCVSVRTIRDTHKVTLTKLNARLDSGFTS